MDAVASYSLPRMAVLILAVLEANGMQEGGGERVANKVGSEQLCAAETYLEAIATRFRTLKSS